MTTFCKGMANKLNDDSLTLPDLETQSCSLFLKVRDFSDGTIHTPGTPAELAEYFVDGGSVGESFFLDLYANGITNENIGYVSVLFQSTSSLLIDYKYFELSCVISVIDAFENRRFPKSYVFPFHPDWRTDVKNLFPTFTVDQFLRREILLGDPKDFLPGDCLSLHIDVVIRTIDSGLHVAIPVEAVVQNSFAKEESEDGTKYYLHLDSELAKTLTEVSPYFQKMSEAPMLEKSTRYMNVPADEYPFLRDVCFILKGMKGITVDSIDHICQMYVTADKYDIQFGVESCRNLISTLLRVENDPVTERHVEENIPTLLELAEMYNDVRLQESIESISKDNSESSDNDKRTQKRIQSNSETGWKLELVGNETVLYFTFKRDAPEKPELNFYQ